MQSEELRVQIDDELAITIGFWNGATQTLMNLLPDETGRVSTYDLPGEKAISDQTT